MEKINILLKLSFKFFQKYLLGYFKALLAPCLALFLGLILFIAVFFNRNLVLISFLSIPCFLFAFWRGFVVTYALNFASDDFINKTPLDFNYYVEKAKKDGNGLGAWVTFCAILTIILYLPFAFYMVSNFPLIQNGNFKTFYLAYGLNTLILMPFLNYYTQAFYFRKEKENFISLFLNCYRKLDWLGFLIAVIIGSIAIIISNIPYIAFITLFLNFSIQLILSGILKGFSL